MQTNIRQAALDLGYVEAASVTGHPFKIWRERLSSLPLGAHMSFDHDPAQASGWPREEITIWIAYVPTPPLNEYPAGYGCIGTHYVCSARDQKRRIDLQKAVRRLGYEVAGGITLPERAAAIRAGLGVHSLMGPLITPHYGSFVSLALLLIHAKPPAEARGPEFDLSPGCSACGACIAACPTKAISANGVNALLCLRNYIRWPETLPEEDYAKMQRRIQGCDTCQQACPHNAALPRINPPEDLVACLDIEQLLVAPDIAAISRYVSANYIRASMVQTQAMFAAVSTERRDLVPQIAKLTNSEDATQAKIARWAVEKLTE